MRDFQAIYGIDFSGAKDAGNKIWIAKGVPDGGGLLIQDCFRARDLPDSGRGFDACLPPLVHLIESQPNAAFGLDFPFGLPTCLVKEETWDEFILAFPSRFDGPDDLKAGCFSEAGRRELRRRTDSEAYTPFSPYNLRLYKQTYYGISKVLLPLVLDRGACALPFYKPVPGKPSILEICPASTLKSLGLNGIPYKGRSDSHRENRRKILKEIERIIPIRIERADIEKDIIADKGGDALDSVIAAAATFNAIQNEEALIPHDNGYWRIEGHVYV